MRSITRYTESFVSDKIKLDGNKIKNKNQFINELTSKLLTPGYFENTIDSVYEILTDLSWLNLKENLIIEYSNSKNLEKSDPKTFEKIKKIFIEASEYWRDSKFKLNIILQ